MKILSMQLFPAPSNFLPLRTKYIPHRFIFENYLPMFVPSDERTILKPIQNNREDRNYAYLRV